jgi:uroporphyrinogen decarboxylase
MLGIRLENPAPDFESLGRVIKGEKEPQKVYFSELGIDIPIKQYITENVLGENWVPPARETRQAYQKQMISLYSRLGYDYIQIWVGWTNLPEFRERKAADTAGLSKGQRRWVEEGGGIIKDWDDFERIDWANIRHDLGGVTRDDFHGLDYAKENLPDGMKMTVGFPFFEMILEWFFGYEDLFILSVDNPELVEAVFDQWGHKLYEAYKEAVQHPEVGAIFHADDLGYKTSTMLSPEFLRKNVFPWLKKYACLAHERTCFPGLKNTLVLLMSKARCSGTIAVVKSLRLWRTLSRMLKLTPFILSRTLSFLLENFREDMVTGLPR